jgi:hypothetical protein
MTLSSFVNALAKDPLWKFAWGIFVSLVIYLSVFISGLPEQMAQFEEYNVQDQTKAFELTRARRIIPLLTDVFSELVGATKDFEKRTEIDGRSVVPSHESARLGLEKVREARDAITEAHAILKAMSFEKQRLAKRASEFASDLETFDEVTLPPTFIQR